MLLSFFSISAGILQALSFTLLYEIVSSVYWRAYLIALSLGVGWYFALHRIFTFKFAANVPVAMFKVSAFYMVFTLSTTVGEIAWRHWE